MIVVFKNISEGKVLDDKLATFVKHLFSEAMHVYLCSINNYNTCQTFFNFEDFKLFTR